MNALGVLVSIAGLVLIVTVMFSICGWSTSAHESGVSPERRDRDPGYDRRLPLVDARAFTVWYLRHETCFNTISKIRLYSAICEFCDVVGGCRPPSLTRVFGHVKPAGWTIRRGRRATYSPPAGDLPKVWIVSEAIATLQAAECPAGVAAAIRIAAEALAEIAQERGCKASLVEALRDVVLAVVPLRADSLKNVELGSSAVTSTSRFLSANGINTVGFSRDRRVVKSRQRSRSPP